MEEEKINWKLFLVLLFLGWLGLDKFYMGGKKNWKLFLLKFAANLIGIGELWNILDIVMCLLKKYEVNPLEYLDQIENRHKFG